MSGEGEEATALEQHQPTEQPPVEENSDPSQQVEEGDENAKEKGKKKVVKRRKKTDGLRKSSSGDVPTKKVIKKKKKATSNETSPRNGEADPHLETFTSPPSANPLVAPGPEGETEPHEKPETEDNLTPPSPGGEDEPCQNNQPSQENPAPPPKLPSPRAVVLQDKIPSPRDAAPPPSPTTSAAPISPTSNQSVSQGAKPPGSPSQHRRNKSIGAVSPRSQIPVSQTEIRGYKTMNREERKLIEDAVKQRRAMDIPLALPLMPKEGPRKGSLPNVSVTSRSGVVELPRRSSSPTVGGAIAKSGEVPTKPSKICPAPVPKAAPAAVNPQYAKVKARLIRCVILGDADQHENENVKAEMIEQYSGYILSHTNPPILPSGKVSPYLQTPFKFEGKPSFMSLSRVDTESLPEKTDVVVLVFSVVAPSSLDNALNKWLPLVQKKNPDVPVVLVGAQTKYRDNPKYGLSAIPPNFNQGAILAYQNGCSSYIELSDLSDIKTIRWIFDEAQLLVLSPVDKKEVLAIAEKKSTNLSLTNKGLTASSFSVLFATNEKKSLLENVKVLSLANNKLQFLPRAILDMKNLEELYLRDNLMQELTASIGSSLTALKILDLGNNYITRLPLSVKSLTNLQELKLDGTAIIDPPKSPNDLREYFEKRKAKNLRPPTSGGRRRPSLPAMPNFSIQEFKRHSPTAKWDIERVQSWLASVGMQKYQNVFAENHIDGEVLVSLTEEELTKYLSVRPEDLSQLYTDIKLLP